MLKFQAVAEKTAKNFRGLLFCRTLYKIQFLRIFHPFAEKPPLEEFA